MNIQELLYNRSTNEYELLMTPIHRLELKIRGSRIDRLIQSVRQELRKKKFVLKPTFYISDEFGCVQDTTNIGIPFYLVSEDLEALNQQIGSEKHQILNNSQIKALLRHECGHAFFYAYEIYKNSQAQSLFGNFSSKRIPLEKINWDPHECVDYIEKRGVATLGYTRTHPEEDFSNTFAAWLDPHEKKSAYTNKALQKLQFINRLSRRYAARKPQHLSKTLHKPQSALRETIGSFFEHYFGPFDLSSFEQEATGFIDSHLKNAFSSHTSSLWASTFLERNKRRLIREIKSRIKHKPWINPLIQKSIERCKTLHLWVPGGNSQKALKIFSATLILMATLLEENGRAS